ncbi:hypothetical protein D3C77_347940 [compost metagenome]
MPAVVSDGFSLQTPATSQFFASSAACATAGRLRDSAFPRRQGLVQLLVLVLLVEQVFESRTARLQEDVEVTLHLIFTETDIEGADARTEHAFGLIAPASTPAEHIANPAIGQTLARVEPGFDSRPAKQAFELLAARR